MKFLRAFVIYEWHKRVKKCPGAIAMKFRGAYTRIECMTCGEHLWQKPGLFGGPRR